MWLINTKTYNLEYFVNPLSCYTILSHTWEEDEVLFQDMESLQHAQSKAGWKKIQLTCEESRQANILYTWVDTCCIDKRSSAELSEAINSMFSWYQQSSVCYVYLSDLEFPCSPVDSSVPKSDEGRQWADAAFSQLECQLSPCRWFTRGWTLQELIAPSKVVFFDKSWNPIGSRVPGADSRFLSILERLTGIPGPLLEYKSDIATIPVGQRMSWAAGRQTTRIEDIAYCLLGIFDVSMPLLYGEGPKSFLRLQEEIVKNHDDLSLFAWKQDAESYGIGAFRGCFASSPNEFAHWLNVKIEMEDLESGMEVTSKNVKMTGRVLKRGDFPAGAEHGVDHIFDLGIRDPGNAENTLGILLTQSSRNLTHFRFKPYELIKLPPRKPSFDQEAYYKSDDGTEYEDPHDQDVMREMERDNISIRTSISVQETRAMGHHQTPMFKIHWHEDVSKILKTVNGRNVKDYIPVFECNGNTAFCRDGTATWVIDFELRINPQLVVSLVLVAGLQWSDFDLRQNDCFERGDLQSQEFWAVLLGEGHAYAMGGWWQFDDEPVVLEELDKIDGNNSRLVEDIKRMDHHKRPKVIRDALVKGCGDTTGRLDVMNMARLIRVISPLSQLPICDVWIESKRWPFDLYGELEIKTGPCHESKL
ncbi:heterokaryon incompatibility protein-domain-containing protein [Fusarium oxysporum]|nr:heterokaryon incompatibility protein-domain-containing protein [Fusarium oxysporum]